jgi:DNA-binding NtrC family response regulator
MKTILIIDDDKSIREALNMILEYEGYVTEFAENGREGLQQIEAANPDLVLLDVKMAGMDGIETLQEIKNAHTHLPVVMISGHGSIETAVEATKIGAFDFLPKPLDRDKLLVTLRNALQSAKLGRDVQELKHALGETRQLVGGSAAMAAIAEMINRVAPTEARVLIMGENGTGKELVARAIHSKSKRRDNLFIEVNCAAIPADLIESELFGHEKGSFTGATQQRIGKFEQADGATLFLDEIGDMSLHAQAKVLRALEQGTIERVGGSKMIAVNVRVLAATNKDLMTEIKKGNFRDDLYHRLNVIPIIVPPLNDRVEDIPELTSFFIKDICQRYGMPLKTISGEGMKLLQKREWSGNVRELRNTVERLVILSKGCAIDLALLTDTSSERGNDLEILMKTSANFQEFKDSAEAAFIRFKLEEQGWNISKTAEILDIQRSHLYTKMKKYGLTKEDENGEAD